MDPPSTNGTAPANSNSPSTSTTGTATSTPTSAPPFEMTTQELNNEITTQETEATRLNTELFNAAILATSKENFKRATQKTPNTHTRLLAIYQELLGRQVLGDISPRSQELRALIQRYDAKRLALNSQLNLMNRSYDGCVISMFAFLDASRAISSGR